PRLRHVEEVRYGDEEQEIVSSIGQGVGKLFFKIEGTDFHYRFYRFPAAGSNYSFLFKNKKLVYVQKKHIPLYECIFQPHSNDCLADIVNKFDLHDESKEVGFSEAIAKEKRTESVAITGAAIAIPAAVIIWPITVGFSGAAAATDAWNPMDDMKTAKKNKACRQKLNEFENRIRPLFPDSTLKEIENTFSGLRLDTSENAYTTKNEIVEDKTFDEDGFRVYGKSWFCGSTEDTKLKVFFGIQNNHISWMSINSHEW
ncbi:MAG: hypothetical protein WBM65_19115, partial [Sedimenticolaceae bacterium]